MVAIAFSSFLVLLILLVSGLWLRRVFVGYFTLSDSLLLGLVVSNSFCSYLSLFFPINEKVLLACLIACLASIPFLKNEWRALLQTVLGRKDVLLYTALFACIALFIATGSPGLYDNGLYHLQSIRWIESYPVVPGLANLHGRFGFNPNVFTLYGLSALTNIFDQEIFSVNFSVCLVLMGYFIQKLVSIGRKSLLEPNFLIYLLLFLGVLKLFNFSGPSPDFISNALILYIFARVLDCHYRSEEPTFYTYFPLMLIASYLLTVKLSTAPVLVIFSGLMIQSKITLRQASLLLLGFGLILLPWLIRNVLLSSWLIYPFPSIDWFNFDWKVPKVSLIREMDAVKGYARNPGPDFMRAAHLTFKEWFPVWVKLLNPVQLVVLLAAFLAPLVLLFSQIAKRINFSILQNSMLITAIAGLWFWFLLAPDIRFGVSFILLAGICPLLFIHPWNMLKPIYRMFLLGYILILGVFIFKLAFLPIAILLVLALMTPGIKILAKLEKYSLAIILSIVMLSYFGLNLKGIRSVLTAGQWMRPAQMVMPAELKFEKFQIRNGFVFVPSSGDQCFDCELPCTPYPDSTLVLRNETIGFGFRHN